jgi:hypothetical protein
MTLKELLPALGRFTKVVVTGPQRAGTTIATKILASELQYPVVLEEVFRQQELYLFVAALIENSTCVVQAPALSAVVHLLQDDDIAVVFMLRKTDEIIQSEQRIQWSQTHEKLEKAKYFSARSKLPIGVLKTRMWHAYQKKLIGERAFELDYESLEGHPLWIDKSLRGNFGTRQTELLPPTSRL